MVEAEARTPRRPARALSRNSRSAEIVSCVQRAASAAPRRELVEADLAGHAEVVVAGEADRGVRGARARRRRPARRRSRRDRRGTTSPRRPRLRRRRAPPRRRAGCRGCRSRSRPAWRTVDGAAQATPSRRSASPRSSLRRRRCSCCGRRSGTRWWKRRRDRTSAPAEIERATGFRSGQLWLFGARTVVELGILVLGASATRRGPGKRPLLTAAATAAALSLHAHHGRAAAEAPRRASAPTDVGLITQSLGRLGGGRREVDGDRRGVFAAGGGALLVARDPPLRRATGGRRARRRRRLRGRRSPTLGPVVLDPLFNKFKPLPAGDARRTCSSSRARPASRSARSTRSTPRRRTTAANAYVTGLGPHEARRALRHAAEGLHARRDAARRRPRARPRALRRRPGRAAVARDRRAVRHARSVARADGEAHARRSLPGARRGAQPRARHVPR